MSWWNVGIAAASAIYGAYSSDKQGKAAKKAGKDPRAGQRTQVADSLMKLLENPSSFFGNPLYQAAFGQGTQAVTRGMASQGYAGSGNMAAGLQQFGQSFAWDQAMSYEKMLAEIAGFSHFPDQGASLMGMQSARSGMMNSLETLGSIYDTYQGGASLGTPSGSGGSIYDTGVGATYGSTPFGRGSWDQLNTGKP